MAQTTEKVPGLLKIENLSVSVPQSGNTTILEVPVEDISFLGVELDVSSFLLDAFIVQGMMHPNGSFSTLYSSAGSYTTPAGLIVGASGDLTALAAGAHGWLLLNVLPLYAVRIQVSSGNASGSTVTARAIGKN